MAVDTELGDYKIKAISKVDPSKFGTITAKVISKSDHKKDTDEPETNPSDTDKLEIIKQPSSQNIKKGRTANFSVEVAGTSPFKYQWRKNEIDLVYGSRIIGANKGNLTIENVIKSDAGEYDCIITDEIGNITTISAVTLKVK